jgi:hypothetical protein
LVNISGQLVKLLPSSIKIANIFSYTSVEKLLCWGSFIKIGTS